jgi:bacteriorhodopsin
LLLLLLLIVFCSRITTTGGGGGGGATGVAVVAVVGAAGTVDRVRWCYFGFSLRRSSIHCEIRCVYDLIMLFIEIS